MLSFGPSCSFAGAITKPTLPAQILSRTVYYFIAVDDDDDDDDTKATKIDHIAIDC